MRKVKVQNVDFGKGMPKIAIPLTGERLPALYEELEYVLSLIHICMDKVMGRTDDMLIIKGVNVFPSQIESVLVATENVGPHYQLVVRKKNFMDNLEVKVCLLYTSRCV